MRVRITGEVVDVGEREWATKSGEKRVDPLVWVRQEGSALRFAPERVVLADHLLEHPPAIGDRVDWICGASAIAPKTGGQPFIALRAVEPFGEGVKPPRRR